MSTCPNCGKQASFRFVRQVDFKRIAEGTSSREVRARCGNCGKDAHIRIVADGPTVYKSEPFLPEHTRSHQASYRRTQAEG